MGETTQLLGRWRSGDESALAEVLTRHLPFVRQRVRELLGPALRAKLTSEDVVQDAVLDFLRNGPQFVPANGRQLQRLLSRVVVNTICDHGNWFRAARRSLAGETALTSSLAAPVDGGAGPAAVAAQAELADRLRLALELLDESDRQLILLREWEKRPFAAIGSQLGLGEEAARAAFRRAMERLRATMAGLRRGEIDRLLDRLDGSEGA
ncbi:MAG: sigma-70 family RNA polymerase sigma factor [Planctomycetes bacterium]|nr:sigma-70 family RNA polymerase sigma factor [Planctomycetota bacterium]